MTSNQLLVNEELCMEENREMFLSAVKDYRDKGWLKILDRFVRSSLLPERYL